MTGNPHQPGPEKASSRFVLPFLVLYLTRELGFSLARAGSMLAIYGASAIVFGPIGGRLSDRIGALPVMRVSLIASGCVLLLFPLAKSFAAVASMTVLWAGCAEMLGGALTVRVASLLLAVPKLFVTTQRNFAPLSAKVVVGIVKLEAFAPVMFTMFRCH